MKTKKKEKTPMEILTAGHAKFMKGKQLNPNGSFLFNETIKKAATTVKK